VNGLSFKIFHFMNVFDFKTPTSYRTFKHAWSSYIAIEIKQFYKKVERGKSVNFTNCSLFHIKEIESECKMFHIKCIHMIKWNDGRRCKWRLDEKNPPCGNNEKTIFLNHVLCTVSSSFEFPIVQNDDNNSILRFFLYFLLYDEKIWG
jgi:hypothetical protein